MFDTGHSDIRVGTGTRNHNNDCVGLVGSLVVLYVEDSRLFVNDLYPMTNVLCPMTSD